MFFSKVFCCSPTDLETEINSWFQENPGITIISTNQSEAVDSDQSWDVTFTIVYKA